MLSYFLLPMLFLMAFGALYVLFQSIKRRLTPDRTVQATVKQKTQTSYHASTGTEVYRHWATFSLAENQDLSLRVTKAMYEKLGEGQHGQLTYQFDSCRNFEPYHRDQPCTLPVSGVRTSAVSAACQDSVTRKGTTEVPE